MNKDMTTTEQAVAQLRAYARYIDRHAEAIIGDIDAPNYVSEGGIEISFALLLHDTAPTVNVRKEYMALEVIREDAS